MRRRESENGTAHHPLHALEINDDRMLGWDLHLTVILGVTPSIQSAVPWHLG